MVLAVSGGEVIGQARGMVHRHPDLPTELYIDNLGVTEDRRREGIATRLLDELVAWGREKGCEEAWVGTEVDNAPARTLYERRGSEAETFVLYFYEFAGGVVAASKRHPLSVGPSSHAENWGPTIDACPCRLTCRLRCGSPDAASDFGSPRRRRSRRGAHFLRRRNEPEAVLRQRDLFGEVTAPRRSTQFWPVAAE